MGGSKVKTLLLDLDGTLIDSRSDLTSAVNFALVSTGRPAQEQKQIVPHVGNGLRVLLGNVMGPVTEEVLTQAISAFSEYYHDHCVDKTILYAGVLDSLKEIHHRVKMGVVTNKPYHFSRKILEELKVASYFGALVGGDSVPEKKPHPAPVLKALNDLGGRPEEALILGDGPQDILAGQAVGMKTCAAGYGYGFQKDLLKLKPDFTINSFKEIKEIVL